MTAESSAFLLVADGDAFGDFSFFLGSGDALGQALQLGAIEDFGVDEADEEGLDGALAEPVDDALGGAAGDALAGLGGAIDEGAVFDRVSQVALFFKAAKDGADGGVLERAAKLLADLVGGDARGAPDDGENAPLEFAEFRGIVTI